MWGSKGKVEPLKAGDTIGVIALSSPCEEVRFLRGVKALESRGYKVKVAGVPWKYYGKKDYLFSSDSVEERVKGLHELLRDKEVKAIIGARGAYGSQELLPHIDFDLWRKNPKPLCGFSDITAVLVAAYQEAGVSVVHGPTVESSFSKEHESAEAKRSGDELLAVLGGKKSELPAGLPDAPIVGGNLSVLAGLCGTPWQLKGKGHVVFLEETGEKPYRIHRMLLQMRQSGCFEGVRGIVLGYFSNCVHAKGEGPTWEEVVRELTTELKIPVNAGLRSGHELINIAVPMCK